MQLSTRAALVAFVTLLPPAANAQRAPAKGPHQRAQDSREVTRLDSITRAQANEIAALNGSVHTLQQLPTKTDASTLSAYWLAAIAASLSTIGVFLTWRANRQAALAASATATATGNLVDATDKLVTATLRQAEAVDRQLAYIEAQEHRRRSLDRSVMRGRVVNLQRRITQAATILRPTRLEVPWSSVSIDEIRIAALQVTAHAVHLADQIKEELAILTTLWETFPFSRNDVLFLNEWEPWQTGLRKTSELLTKLLQDIDAESE